VLVVVGVVVALVVLGVVLASSSGGDSDETAGGPGGDPSGNPTGDPGGLPSPGGVVEGDRTQAGAGDECELYIEPFPGVPTEEVPFDLVECGFSYGSNANDVVGAGYLALGFVIENTSGAVSEDYSVYVHAFDASGQEIPTIMDGGSTGPLRPGARTALGDSAALDQAVEVARVRIELGLASAYRPPAGEVDAEADLDGDTVGYTVSTDMDRDIALGVCAVFRDGDDRIVGGACDAIHGPVARGETVEGELYVDVPGVEDAEIHTRTWDAADWDF
jgi:hypothetical protein